MMRRPWVRPFVIVVAAAIALGGGYLGVDLYLARSAPAPKGGVAHADPSSAEPSSPATPAPRGRLVLHGTGDVNLDPRQLGSLHTSYGAPWSAVSDLFEGDDLTVVNLECAPSRLGEAVEKEYNFRCEPDALAAMRDAGVDVANQGNNHAGDYGPRALVDGRDNLIAAGVRPVGSGRDAAQANEPAIFERSGWTIAVLGFGGVVPSPDWIAGPDHAGQADGYDVASMTRAVREADEEADLVFVTIHWGAELDGSPRADDVARARALIDAGADGIFGHHAHVVQPLEWYGGRPIAYGLGNFVWPRGGPTAVARFVVEPDGSVGACLVRGTISGGRPTLSDPDC